MSDFEKLMLTVRCPRCGAKPNTPCVTPSGREAEVGHTARYYLTKRLPSPKSDPMIGDPDPALMPKEVER